MKENTNDFNWRVYGQPSLISINVFNWGFKKFNKKNAWMPWTKEEKQLIMEQFDMPHKSFPGFLNQLKPSKNGRDNGQFKAIVRAREVAWILKRKDINLNIGEFIDFMSVWRINEK